jgi:hypothetical protein
MTTTYYRPVDASGICFFHRAKPDPLTRPCCCTGFRFVTG